MQWRLLTSLIQAWRSSLPLTLVKCTKRETSKAVPIAFSVLFLRWALSSQTTIDAQQSKQVPAKYFAHGAVTLIRILFERSDKVYATEANKEPGEDQNWQYFDFIITATRGVDGGGGVVNRGFYETEGVDEYLEEIVAISNKEVWFPYDYKSVKTDWRE